MQEVDAIDFMTRVVDDDDAEEETRERVLEAHDGAALPVELTPVDRGFMLDQIQKLPDEMLEALVEAEDTEEAEARAQEQNMFSSLNSETIDAFEQICAASIRHEDLTSDHIEKIVDRFDLEVLFPIGSEVMEMSMDNDGGVQDFHEPS